MASLKTTMSHPTSLRRAGDASVLILTSLADGPKHGYALIQDIRTSPACSLDPERSTGALDRLERLGLIAELPSEDRRHPLSRDRGWCNALRSHLDALERVSMTGRLRLGLGTV